MLSPKQNSFLSLIIDRGIWGSFKFGRLECLWSYLQKRLRPLCRRNLWLLKEANDKRPLNRHAKQSHMSLPIQPKLAQYPLTGLVRTLTHAHDYRLRTRTLVYSGEKAHKDMVTHESADMHTQRKALITAHVQRRTRCRRAHKHAQQSETCARLSLFLAPSK